MSAPQREFPASPKRASHLVKAESHKAISTFEFLSLSVHIFFSRVNCKGKYCSLCVFGGERFITFLDILMLLTRQLGSGGLVTPSRRPTDTGGPCWTTDGLSQRAGRPRCSVGPSVRIHGPEQREVREHRSYGTQVQAGTPHVRSPCVPLCSDCTWHPRRAHVLHTERHPSRHM